MLTLLVVEKNGMLEEIGRKADAQSATETAAETTGMLHNDGKEYEIVKAAEFPVEKNTIVIEEEQVPLAALPIEAETAEENAEETAAAVQGNTAGTVRNAVSVEETEKTQDSVSIRDANESQNAASTQDAQKQQTDQNGTDSKAEDLGNGIYGYYDEQASLALLTQINKMRTEAAGVSALTGELNDIAEKRALSCIKDFSHNGMETAGECMAIGQADAAGVITSWYASDDHRTYVSDPAYTQAGTACIRYDKGNGEIQTIWVLVLN